MALTFIDENNLSNSLEGVNGTWTGSLGVVTQPGDVAILVLLVVIRGNTTSVTTTIAHDGDAVIGARYRTTGTGGGSGGPYWSMAMIAGAKVATGAATTFNFSGTTSGVVPFNVGIPQSGVRSSVSVFRNAYKPTSGTVTEHARGTQQFWSPGSTTGPALIGMGGTSALRATADDDFGFPNAPASQDFSRANIVRHNLATGTLGMGTWDTSPGSVSFANTNAPRLCFFIPLAPSNYRVGWHLAPTVVGTGGWTSKRVTRRF